MKKILIIVIILILIVLGYFVLIKGFKLGPIQIQSIYDVKSKNHELEENIKLANQTVSITYPEKIDKVNKAIKDLQDIKEKYSIKTDNEQIDNINVTQIKYYEIDYLWAKLGNYATDNGIELTLDVKTSSSGTDIYNLKFVLSGSYIGITDFIYSIENDEELKFKIQDFAINPTVTEKVNDKNTVTSTTVNTSTLSSTFVVKDIGIRLK